MHGLAKQTKTFSKKVQFAFGLNQVLDGSGSLEISQTQNRSWGSVLQKCWTLNLNLGPVLKSSGSNFGSEPNYGNPNMRQACCVMWWIKILWLKKKLSETKLNTNWMKWRKKNNKRLQKKAWGNEITYHRGGLYEVGMSCHVSCGGYGSFSSSTLVRVHIKSRESALTQGWPKLRTKPGNAQVVWPHPAYKGNDTAWLHTDPCHFPHSRCETGKVEWGWKWWVEARLCNMLDLKLEHGHVIM